MKHRLLIEHKKEIKSKDFDLHEQKRELLTFKEIGRALNISTSSAYFAYVTGINKIKNNAYFLNYLKD